MEIVVYKEFRSIKKKKSKKSIKIRRQNTKNTKNKNKYIVVDIFQLFSYKYQYVLRRASPFDNHRGYELTTITYVMNCSPYLANRIIQNIAESDCADVPLVRLPYIRHTLTKYVLEWTSRTQ